MFKNLLSLQEKKGVDLDPKSNNASTLERLMERIRNKYQTPSILSFKIGSMGNSYRFNQNFTYDTNVTAKQKALANLEILGTQIPSFFIDTILVQRKVLRIIPNFDLTTVTILKETYLQLLAMITISSPLVLEIVSNINYWVTKREHHLT